MYLKNHESDSNWVFKEVVSGLRDRERIESDEDFLLLLPGVWIVENKDCFTNQFHYDYGYCDSISIVWHCKSCGVSDLDLILKTDNNWRELNDSTLVQSSFLTVQKSMTGFSVPTMRVWFDENALGIEIFYTQMTKEERKRTRKLPKVKTANSILNR
jgi:hypothetical protein